MTEGPSGIRVCVSGAFSGPAAFLAWLSDNPSIDQREDTLFEVRLDLMQGTVDDALDLVSRLGRRAVVSCRTRQDGGRWDGSEPDRMALLSLAAARGPMFVDVELATWMRGGGEAVRKACSGPCSVMVSVHEQGSSAFFGDLARRLNSTGATAVKLAGVTRDAGDLVRLAAAGRLLSAPVRCVVGMGGAGPFTRMTPSLFGAGMTFASAGQGLETAEGQPDFPCLLACRVFESPGLQPVVLAGGPQVAGSPGPDVLNRLFAARGLPFQYLAMPASDWDQVMAAANFFDIRRFSVTMPFKRMPAQQWPDAVRDGWVDRTGVVNTVVIDGPQARLLNTDAGGMTELFDRFGGVADRTVLIMGGGSTARSVAAASIAGGARVAVAARGAVAVEREWSTLMPGVRFCGWERRGEFAHDVVVNATPVGGDGKSTPIDCSGLRAVHAAVDVVMPSGRPTVFVQEAARRKLLVASGLDFWAAQAPIQLQAFCGVSISHEDVVAAMDAAGRRVDGVMAALDTNLPGSGLEPVYIPVPGSKSVTQRYLILAAVSRNPSRLLHPSPSRDCQELQRALSMLGVRFGGASDCLDVYPADFPKDPGRPIPTGEGGTTLRFLSALSLLCDFELRLVPSGAMVHRPMEAMWDSLRAAGVDVTSLDGVVCLRRRVGPAAVVPVDCSVSSQFASALALAGTGLAGGLKVDLGGNVVSRPYLDMTIQAIRDFGSAALLEGRSLSVTPGPGTRGLRLEVEYDASLSAFWDAATMIFGRTIEVSNRPPAGAVMQGDVVFADLARELGGPGPVTLDLSSCPDLLPPLVAVAMFRKDLTVFSGIGHARLKESDRPRVLAEQLRRLGADMLEEPQRLTIRPSRLRGPAELDPCGDHRMAMTFGILSLRVPGLKILDYECVNKSYPAFWQDLDKVRN